jgi:hypothetical protein
MCATDMLQQKMFEAVFSVRSVPSWESRRLVWDAEQAGSTVTD